MIKVKLRLVLYQDLEKCRNGWYILRKTDFFYRVYWSSTFGFWSFDGSIPAESIATYSNGTGAVDQM